MRLRAPYHLVLTIRFDSRQVTAELPLPMTRWQQQHLQRDLQQHAALRSSLVLQGVQMCADLLKQRGLARLPGAAGELADCSSMLAAKVSRWRSSDECLECKESGSDCDKCAQVAKGKIKGTYSGGNSAGGEDNLDRPLSDDEIKEMEEFFKGDPIFNDPEFRDEFFKEMGRDDFVLPPGVGQPPWMGTGSDDLRLPPLPPMSPEEEAEFKKFEKEMDADFKKFDKEMAAAVTAVEVDDARSRRGRGSSVETSLPLSLARAPPRAVHADRVEAEGPLRLRPQDWLGSR